MMRLILCSLALVACSGAPADTTGATQGASSSTTGTEVPAPTGTSSGSSGAGSTDGAGTSTSTTGEGDPDTGFSGEPPGGSSSGTSGGVSGSGSSTGAGDGDSTTGGLDCDPAKTLIIAENEKVLLDEPADVLALAGIECIDGQVQLYGSAGSLAPLKSLRRISFSLGAYGDGFTDNGLLGLENLEFIGEGITISSTDLLDLSGLEGLKEVGWVNLHLNSKLVSVDGLDGLEMLHGGLYLGSNLLGSNHLLASVAALAGLQEIGGDLEISGTALADLTGLAQITSVGGYARIQGNKQLPTCLAQGFIANVKVADEVAINSNLADQCGD